MDEYAGQAGPALLSHPEHCPPWCEDCRHYDTDSAAPPAWLHRGPADTVTVYDEGWDLVDAEVRPAFWVKGPGFVATDPAELERPYVEVRVPTERESEPALEVSLSPAQARRLAAALLRAADTADAWHPVPAAP
ncbi:hypothetical protein [Actinoplanes sp. NBRC 103695]|uniref:DUF6907 domain-containing protein n=1 Tax=Actinoplanes sp. NBRC 103695 TaxID=3032202 RepID=UPI0024A02942|nr:hypothetical protein [Actinoplanes sp. NBRC 103695]GLY98826.1 hypothetical protein Acsp02_60800 [Actinoplanes sp. NBRC 103695]